MTTLLPDTLRWDTAHGRLAIDEALLAALTWPEVLKLECSADGLILTAWDAQTSAEGVLVCSVTYEDEHEQESDMPYLAISAEQARTVGLQEGHYTAWVAPWDDCIYAIPGRLLALEPSGLISVTVMLLPREVQLLEQLALQYRGRMIDILTGFAADLAAEYAVGNERYQLRSGGSDERMLADAWFQRNLAPGDDAGASADQGEFARRFRFSTTEEQQA